MANKIVVGRRTGRNKSQKVVFEEVFQEESKPSLPLFNPKNYVRVYRSLRGEEYRLPTWALREEAREFQLTPSIRENID